MRSAPGDVERELDREVHVVGLEGMTPNRLDEGVVVLVSPNLVPAVAPESLASEHVAPDTRDVPLEAR